MKLLSYLKISKNQLLLSSGGALFWVIIISLWGSPHHTFKGNWQDNVSNISATQLFFLEGFKIFERPVGTFVQPLAESEVPSRFLTGVEPTGWFWHSKLGREAPLFFVWPEVPRPYPLGAWMFYAPSSIFVYQLGLSMALATLFNCFLFLFIAHFCVFLFYQNLSRELESSLQKSSFLQWTFRFFLFVLYVEFINWSGQGQYDLIAMLPLVAFFIELKNSRWKQAILFYSLALSFHFRTLFSMGSLLYVGILSLFEKNREQNIVQGRNFVWVGSALVLGLTSTFIFYMNSSYLTNTEIYQHNPFHLQNLIHFSGLEMQLFLAIGLSLVICLIRGRSWHFLAWYLFAFLVLVSTPQLRSWYVMFLFPGFLLIGSRSRHSKAQQFYLMCCLYIYFASFILHQSPFEFQFVRELLEIFSGKNYD